MYSIITVCRNEEGAIRETCESIIAQELKDFEWIVIDGASTDGTIEILNEYRSSIRHLISEPDAGIYNAMNKGAALATGRYLIFMNGGDCFATPQALNMASQSVAAQVIYGDVYLGGLDSEIQTYPDVIEAGYLLRKMLPHQATFYQRETFELVGGYDESYKICGDYDLDVRLFEIEHVSHHHVRSPISMFDTNGISNDPVYRALKKQENHRVRRKYFSKYRRSWKCLRQELRNWLAEK